MNALFLLGGHDLEMIAISSILKERGVLYVDLSLRWDNACLSRYWKELSDYGDNDMWTIYGVELQEDMPVPSNYIRIDHHNDYSFKATSLEQVAMILDYPLTRYLRLVAANDVAYIPGLCRVGATLEEIERIRLADRRAQGITDKEEQLAQEAIRESKEVCGDLIIVKACTSCFSPICDRLYPYRRILIYTCDELMYCGRGISVLVAKYQNEGRNECFFYGGGDDGYWGVVKGSLHPNEIKYIVEQIKNMEL